MARGRPKKTIEATEPITPIKVERIEEATIGADYGFTVSNAKDQSVDVIKHKENKLVWANNAADEFHITLLTRDETGFVQFIRGSHTCGFNVNNYKTYDEFVTALRYNRVL